MLSALFVPLVVIIATTCFPHSVLAQYSYVDQGEEWTDANRDLFYTQDQGSEIMPYAWAKALREPDGQLFWRDSGSRYGFLPNLDLESSDNHGLPVGFFVVGKKDTVLSTNCAACHTRQIIVENQEYRIDGGPAFADFYAFFKDLFEAVEHTKSNKVAFQVFQKDVGTPSRKLQKQLDDWYTTNFLVLGESLPVIPWGVGRLDALSNIFNRVNGAMIGSPRDNFLIPENVSTADYPVRFPFLWNVGRQDLTQWTGSSINGNRDYALARNAAQLCGVWGMIHPRGNNFLVDNTTNYEGLEILEESVRTIGPPEWPWDLDLDKASQGAELYENNCASCHGIQPGAPRPPVFDTWLTPVHNVGTDIKYWLNLARLAPSSGLMTGRKIPSSGYEIQPYNELAARLVAVVNQTALLQKFPELDFTLTKDPTPPGSYESRVLEGVWASAPYLHNGSVPSLAELLKPAVDRESVFEVGPAYDLVNVGIAEEQPEWAVKSVFFVNPDLFSGDSNAGHEYGTDLSPEEKEALLEYLKTL